MSICYHLQQSSVGEHILLPRCALLGLFVFLIFSSSHLGKGVLKLRIPTNMNIGSLASLFFGGRGKGWGSLPTTTFFFKILELEIDHHSHTINRCDRLERALLHWKYLFCPWRKFAPKLRVPPGCLQVSLLLRPTISPQDLTNSPPNLRVGLPKKRFEQI